MGSIKQNIIFDKFKTFDLHPPWPIHPNSIHPLKTKFITSLNDPILITNFHLSSTLYNVLTLIIDNLLWDFWSNTFFLLRFVFLEHKDEFAVLIEST